MAYETTEVQVDKSQADVRRLLREHGATNFSFGEGTFDGVVWALVEFVHHDQLVRIRVPLKMPDTQVVATKARRATSRTAAQIRDEMLEQEARRIWRVLLHGLKARLVSVQEGVETFEQAFLAHLVDPVTGRSLWESARGLIESGAMRLGGVGIELGPPQLGPAPLHVVGTPLGADDITADDTCSTDVNPDVVDAEVVG